MKTIIFKKVTGEKGFKTFLVGRRSQSSISNTLEMGDGGNNGWETSSTGRDCYQEVIKLVVSYEVQSV